MIRKKYDWMLQLIKLLTEHLSANQKKANHYLKLFRSLQYTVGNSGYASLDKDSFTETTPAYQQLISVNIKTYFPSKTPSCAGD